MTTGPAVAQDAWIYNFRYSKHREIWPTLGSHQKTFKSVPHEKAIEDTLTKDSQKGLPVSMMS